MKVDLPAKPFYPDGANEPVQHPPIEAPQQSSPKVGLKRWQGDVFAAAVTVATLASRLALGGQLKDRPILTILTVPIMLAAYVGGLRGGLLATAISYFGASYYLLPPFHSFGVAATVDRWNLFFLVLAGVLISVLNEALHRARHQAAIATSDLQTRVALVKAQALQSAIFNSTGFASIATDEKGVIQIFNVGAQRMLGYSAADVVHRLTPAELADPQEMISRAQALGAEFGTPIAPGLETLIYKASRGLEYVYEPTLIRKDGSRFPAVVSVAALRDAQETIIGYLLIGTDNSARKRAEEDRERFFKLSEDVLCTLGFDGYFKELNPAWETTLGYTRAELLATPFIEFVHPDDHQRTLSEAEKVAGGKALIAFENRYRCKDGTYRWFQWNVTPVMEDRVMYGAARDVTQRKQTEAALLKAGALQRAIFNSANFSSIATDAKGVIQIFNVGAERMLGYTAAEVMNKITPAQISDPQEVISRAEDLSLELGTPITPGFEALVFKASRGIEDIYELTYIRRDGSRFPAVVSVTALRDAQEAIIGYLLIGTDNTARKLAEEALLKAGALQRAIFNSANFSSIATDAKGVIQIFNVGAERMLGYTAAEVMNKITPADISDPQEVIDRAQALSVELETPIKPGFEALVFKASRGIEDIYELTYIRKDGSRFPAAVSVTALRDARDAIIGYLLIGTDNTARLAAQLLAAVVESSSDAVIGKDLKGVVTSWNATAERMFGYSADEMIGCSITRIIPQSHHDDEEQILSRIRRGEIIEHFETQRLTKAGGLVDVSVTVSPIKNSNGRVIGASKVARDITERNRAAAEIRQLNIDLERRVVERTTQLLTANSELEASSETLYDSQERYRSLVDSAKEYAILILDTQGNITTWNDGAQRIKGYSAEEIIGSHFSIFYPAEDAKLGKPREELKIALGAGQYEEDGWRVRKGGAMYWANVVITVLRDRHGNHLGFSKIVRDLTDRKNAEEKLRESEEWLRSLVEGGRKYAIVTLDTEGNVTTWNAGAQRIKGYRADEIIGKHLSIFYPAEDVKRGKPQRELKIAAETGEYEEDGWRVRKDSSLFWANVLLSVLRDSHGKHLGFSKVTRDLTDTVRAEEQARSFFTVSLEMLCIVGFDGFFKLLNPVWEQTLGFTPEELCAKPYIDFVHPDDVAATSAAGLELSSGKQLNHFENRYRCKDGSYRWLAWSVAVSADRQFMYCAAADITLRRRTENEIASLNETLLRQNLELDSSNKELESFSYSVSHDLRAPLRAIDGFSQALSEDYADKLNAEGQDSLGRIRKASQRMGHLIDDLLNLSRLSRAEMKREAVDLSRMARDILKDLQESEPERQVACLVADGLTADGDPHLLHVVLTNLLANAWKFSAKCPDSRIEFGSVLVNGNTAFFVRDNGAGFDMAYAGKLFGAFQRLHSMADFPGTGVGLATVQRIIHRHHGRVWAQSAVGSGATFHFTLTTQANVAAA